MSADALPPDFVDNLATALTHSRDLAAFACVCKAWNAASLQQWGARLSSLWKHGDRSGQQSSTQRQGPSALQAFAQRCKKDRDVIKALDSMQWPEHRGQAMQQLHNMGPDCLDLLIALVQCQGLHHPLTLQYWARKALAHVQVQQAAKQLKALSDNCEHSSCVAVDIELGAIAIAKGLHPLDPEPDLVAPTLDALAAEARRRMGALAQALDSHTLTAVQALGVVNDLLVKLPVLVEPDAPLASSAPERRSSSSMGSRGRGWLGHATSVAATAAPGQLGSHSNHSSSNSGSVVQQSVTPAAAGSGVSAEVPRVVQPCLGSYLLTVPPDGFGIGLKGASGASYYSQDMSLLHRVLASRQGIPISLCCVHMAVCRRVGLPVGMLNTPGHVINKLYKRGSASDQRSSQKQQQDQQHPGGIIITPSDEDLYIDVYDGAAVMTLDECIAWSHQSGRGVSQQTLQEAASAQAMLTRMRTNMLVVAQHMGELYDLQQLVELCLYEAPELLHLYLRVANQQPTSWAEMMSTAADPAVHMPPPVRTALQQALAKLQQQEVHEWAVVRPRGPGRFIKEPEHRVGMPTAMYMEPNLGAVVVGWSLPTAQDIRDHPASKLSEADGREYLLGKLAKTEYELLVAPQQARAFQAMGARDLVSKGYMLTQPQSSVGWGLPNQSTLELLAQHPELGKWFEGYDPVKQRYLPNSATLKRYPDDWRDLEPGLLQPVPCEETAAALLAAREAAVLSPRP